jgi:hypothetical protein
VATQAPESVGNYLCQAQARGGRLPQPGTLYQREALLRDSRSLREDSRFLCGRERSVVKPTFAECGVKNRSSQSSQR